MKTLMERRKHLTQSVFFLGGDESKQVQTQGQMRKYSETTTKKNAKKSVKIGVNLEVCVELVVVAAPEDLSRTALRSPPRPINVKLSGSREAIRL